MDFSKDTFTVETGLCLLWDVSRLPELRPEKLRMPSSGATYPQAKDGCEFLYRETNGEYVLFDATGPGCLVRYWTAKAQPDQVIRFYFDGHATPDVEFKLTEMFTGEMYPWVQPVVGDPDLSSGGAYSYLPMPYKLGCKVTLNTLPAFYHLESINLPDYGDVKTFDLADAESWRPALDEAVTNLRAVGTPEHDAPTTKSLAAGETLVLADLEGPAVIESFTLNITPMNPALLRDVVIRAFWDDESTPSVWTPLGDFFVNGHEKVEFRALTMGSTMDGFYCTFPMPFAKRGRIELVNESEEPLTVAFTVAHRALPAFPEDWGYFHARFTRMDTQLDEYVPLLETRGRGKFVGVSFSCQAISPWMLEGDEVVWADGELTPSIHGTGTEDYFNGAWYFDRGTFDLPFHGAPLLELTPTGQLTRVSLYRVHTLDPFSFMERVKVYIEHGQELTMQGSDYCFTTYWYQTEPHLAPFDMPAPAARRAECANVLKEVAAFAPWDEACKAEDDEAIAELGLNIVASFPNIAYANWIRYYTGHALRRLGRLDEAIKVWREAEGYLGVDYVYYKQCRNDAWVYGAEQGPCPTALLNVPRLVEPQEPGEFDLAIWQAMPVATDFRPHFPHPYCDEPADIQTYVRMAYDEEYLYALITCEEPRAKALAVGETVTIENDCFCIHLDAGRTLSSFTLLAVDPDGRCAAKRVTDGRAFWLQDRVLDAALPAEVATRVTDDAWMIELRVPRAAMHLTGDLTSALQGLEFMRVRKVDLDKPEVMMWGPGTFPISIEEFGLARFL